jgi:hypothetical protein
MATPTKTTKGTWRIQIEICGVRKSRTFKDEASAIEWANQKTRVLKQAGALRLKEAESALATAVPKRMLEALRSVPHDLHDVLRAAIPAASFTGIYFLILGGDVVYVGQSIDILNRISKHRREGKEFDSYAYMLCEREKLNDLEALYITALMPWLNFTLGRVPRNI